MEDVVHAVQSFVNANCDKSYTAYDVARMLDLCPQEAEIILEELVDSGSIMRDSGHIIPRYRIIAESDYN